MTAPPTTEQARRLVRDALRAAVPGVDVDVLTDDEDFRDTLELDSLDFLAFVERLSADSGIRIDEDDYAGLRTVGGCLGFLTASG